nr:MAG TPA: hypothetical protein [Caudoviricetes sp.]
MLSVGCYQCCQFCTGLAVLGGLFLHPSGG